MSKVFVIFKITNLLTGKYYLSYYSGKSTSLIRINNKELLNDIKLFNKINFKKEIIEYFTNKKEMLFSLKQMLKENNVINSTNTYNLTCVSNNIKVIDKNNNILKISKTDPRYLSGELKHVNAGKTIVKDPSGNNIKININDPRFLSKELKHVNSGKILVKDSSGHILSIYKDDNRFLNKEVVGIMKDKISVRDSSNNTFSIDKNDYRFLSGELKHINFNKLTVKNILTNKYVQINLEDYYKNLDIYQSRLKNNIFVKDSSNNILKINNKDPRYLSGELKHVNIEKVTVKDKLNNFLSVNNKDPRYLNGELIPILKNKINVTNGKKIINVNKDKIPEGFSTIKPTKETILKGLKTKNKKLNIQREKYFLEKYNFNTIVDKNNVTIKKYCKHGNLNILYKEFKKYELNNLNHKNLCDFNTVLCDKCNKNLEDNYYPTKLDHKKFRNFLISIINENNSKNSYIFNELYLKKYFIKLFKSIILYSKDFTSLKFFEKCFIYAFHILPSKCEIEDCNNLAFFSKHHKTYNLYCYEHLNYNFSSYKERELLNWITKFYNDKNIITNHRQLGSELDIYIPNKNLAIEFNGIYWHSEKFKSKIFHYNKWKMCSKHNINLITIWEDYWEDKIKQNIIKSIILNKLNLNITKIYARNCIIKEITNISEEKEFLINNHLDGYIKSSIKLGLYYNNELIFIMTFKKINLKFELIRFCSKCNLTIVGGISKLFNYFITNYKYNKIISYANLDITTGDIYYKLGFKKTNNINLNYWWSKMNKPRYNLSDIKTTKEEHKLLIKNEHQIMSNKNYHKIWGNGNILFEYIKNDKVSL